MNTLKIRQEKNGPVVLFLEREMAGTKLAEFIPGVKQRFSNLFVIVLTNEIRKEEMIFLHELGADNFITKPLSINTIIEKVVFTVRPPGKLAQKLDQAREALSSGKYEQAMSFCREVLEIKPDSPAGLMLLGDIYNRLENSAKALEAYEKAHVSERMYLEPIKKLAQHYRDAGDQEHELENLKKLDQLSPLNIERKMAIGDIELDRGRMDKAREYFNESVKLARREMKDKVSNLHVDIGEKLLPHSPEAAEEYFRKALEAKDDLLESKDVNTFNRLGIALRKQKKPKEAVEEYKRALTIVPEDENLQYNLAMAHMEAGDKDLALRALERALEINPHLCGNSPVVANNIGMIFFHNADKERAAEFFRLALKLKPDYASARKLLARLGEKE
jgi:tetratricopeptide (TPR) repeat protein